MEYIGLWQDETDPENPWIVSLGERNDAGEEIGGDHTLRTYDEDDYDAAKAAAERIAKKRGLTVIEA